MHLSLGFIPLQNLPYIIITLLIAFTVHEFSHAYAAYKFGDSTAKREGRLTLNPIVHLDPIGTLLILFAGFGWARPVPVNRYNFKNPRLAGVVVSLVGPLSNLLLAIIGAGISVLVLGVVIDSTLGMILYNFFNIFIWYNIVLFVFNLLPIPPLDGYRIIQDIVPNNVRAKISQYEVYGMIILLVIFIVEPIRNVTIGPILQSVVPSIFYGINDFFFNLLR